MKIKDQVEKVKEKLDKPMTINTEMYNPFQNENTDKAIPIGSRHISMATRDVLQNKDDEYCTCTRCPQCGKKLRKGGFF